MEKLSSKIAHYFRWMRNDHRHSSICKDCSNDYDNLSTKISEHGQNYNYPESTEQFLSILEGILLWKNLVNSISVLILFNILFW